MYTSSRRRRHLELLNRIQREFSWMFPDIVILLEFIRVLNYFVMYVHWFAYLYLLV